MDTTTTTAPTLNPTLVQYESDTDREQYAEKNAAFCAAFNDGAAYNVVLDIFSDGMSEKTALYYALVCLEDGPVLPFPLFEQAAGVKFDPACGEYDEFDTELLHSWLVTTFPGHPTPGLVNRIDNEAPASEPVEIMALDGRVLLSTTAYTTLIAWARSGELAGANLAGANLAGANLGEAKLSETDLTFANLTDTYLAGADLTFANLTGAKLPRAYMEGADLRVANLTRTDLTGANLCRADLEDAGLREANLSAASLNVVNMCSADLTGAILSRVNLSGASLAGTLGLIDGGHDARGYRVVGWFRSGELRISAGCHDFSLAEARAYWGSADYRKGRGPATQADMLARVEAIAAAHAATSRKEMTMKKNVLGYTVTRDGELLGAPCACNECRAGMRGELSREWGQGHFACSYVPEDLLQAERSGRIYAAYEDGWRWYAV